MKVSLVLDLHILAMPTAVRKTKGGSPLAIMSKISEQFRFCTNTKKVCLNDTPHPPPKKTKKNNNNKKTTISH